MLYKLDFHGFVKNEASKSKVQPYFKKLLKEVEKVYTRRLEGNLLSIYIRGSVSVGRARPYISDLDSVCVVKTPISNKDLLWFAKTAKILEKKYPKVTLVELAVVSQSNLLKSKKYKNLRVYLKTQSFCLKGVDVVSAIPSVKPGKALAQELYGNLDKELETLKKIFTGKIKNKQYLFQKRPIEFWCVWMTRVLLRAGLGLKMIQKPIYSQDLQTCYKVFSKSYPQYKNQMHQLLKWSIKPISNKKELSIFLNDFGPKFIKLWDQAVK